MHCTKQEAYSIFGNNTAGADGNVSRIYLPGNIVTYISGIGIYGPDSEITQRVGLNPDHYIYPSIEGIRNNRDEILSFTIDYIRNLHLYSTID